MTTLLALYQHFRLIFRQNQESLQLISCNTILLRPVHEQALQSGLDHKVPSGVPTVVWWFNYLACLCGGACSIPSPVGWVKDPALLQLWHRSQLWFRFDPWPRNFHMPQLWQKKKKKKKKKRLQPKMASLMSREPCLVSFLQESPTLSVQCQMLVCRHQETQRHKPFLHRSEGPRGPSVCGWGGVGGVSALLSLLGSARTILWQKTSSISQDGKSSGSKSFIMIRSL